MSRLHSISLEALKGATEQTIINFRNDSNLTVIFGENGTGKSSIVDAFDILCNNKIGSLESKSVGGKKEKYLVNLIKEKADCKIKLNYNNSEWTASLGSGYSPTTTGPDNKPKVSILRKEKIHKLVTAQPKDIYDEVKSFIETPNCEKGEDLLNKLSIEYNREYDSAVQSVTDAEESLKSLWTSEDTPGEDYITWAESEIAIDPEEIEVNINNYSNLITLIEDLERKKNTFNTTTNDLKNKEEEFATKNKEFNELASTEEENISELIDVLDKAKKYIEKSEKVDECPVCEQDVNKDDLFTNVQNRLNSKNNFVKLKDELIRSERSVTSLKERLNELTSQFLTAGEKVYNNLLEFIPSELDNEEFDIESYELLIDDNEDKNEEKIELNQKLSQYLISQKDSLVEKKDALTKTKHNFNSISNYLNTINEKKQRAEELEILRDRAMLLHSVFEEERKNYVKELLESISDDIDNMYSKIHPNENLGRIKLTPDPNKRASIILNAMFESAEETFPQAYYSESHLDTLGICLFIALAKLFGDEDTILIFDDVITSADQIHLSRFLTMLEDELDNFQHTIITTHYQILRDKYRYGGGNTQLIELLRWTLRRGVRHTKTKLYIDELEEYIEQEPMDKQIVASKAGIFLELILDNLALMYRCKLPRKSDPFYTLGEYIGAFGRDLKRNLKIEVIDDDGNITEEIPLIDSFYLLPEGSLIRNEVGCHFNLTGDQYSSEDIKEMAVNTLNLAKVLICAECGELPYKNRSGSYYECRCNRKRLYPIID